MIIISIEKYKGEAYCVTMDDGKKIYLHRDIIERFALKAENEISSDELKEILYEADLRKAKRRAMYLINERDYSYIQLFEKLEKNYPPKICFAVADYMAKNGYINDNRYADEIVYSYMVCKRFGPRRVKQELYKRGVRGKIADSAIEKYMDGLYERLASVIEDKFAPELEDPDDFKSVAKVKNALARMGYDYGDINSAISDYFSE